MPARLNAKGPGEFIRDHLQDPQTGGRDYVGGMFQAYRAHLRTTGVGKLQAARAQGVQGLSSNQK